MKEGGVKDVLRSGSQLGQGCGTCNFVGGAVAGVQPSLDNLG